MNRPSTSQVAVVLSLVVGLLIALAVDRDAGAFAGGFFERLLGSFLLLSAVGTLAFGYLGFRQDARGGPGGEGRRIPVWMSRTAAALWGVPLVLGLYYSFVPLECAEGNDLCGLGRGLTFGYSLVAASAASVACGLAWLLYSAARRSADTE